MIRLALIAALAAAAVLASPSAASASCATYSEARAAHPRAHLYWSFEFRRAGDRKCWGVSPARAAPAKIKTKVHAGEAPGPSTLAAVVYARASEVETPSRRGEPAPDIQSSRGGGESRPTSRGVSRPDVPATGRENVPLASVAPGPREATLYFSSENQRDTLGAAPPPRAEPAPVDHIAAMWAEPEEASLDVIRAMGIDLLKRRHLAYALWWK